MRDVERMARQKKIVYECGDFIWEFKNENLSSIPYIKMMMMVMILIMKFSSKHKWKYLYLG